jgi:dTDP-4-dehydrorhamnose 3,5-epimerase
MPAELLPTPISDIFELLAKPFVDHRGAFLNAFLANDPAFTASWGDREIIQINLSLTEEVGTIRGLHLQAAPHSEAKLVRCLQGRVWDVAVDLRRDSDTYRKWHAVELSPDQGNALLIPEGCAHGFQALQSGSELLYLHSGSWVPDAEIGVRWDDPQLAIAWPLQLADLSDRDRNLPFLPY